MGPFEGHSLRNERQLLSQQIKWEYWIVVKATAENRPSCRGNRHGERAAECDSVSMCCLHWAVV